MNFHFKNKIESGFHFCKLTKFIHYFHKLSKNSMIQLANYQINPYNVKKTIFSKEYDPDHITLFFQKNIHLPMLTILTAILIM